ncbi:hypothetical protein Sme01_26960 [Sphaerisporangium melleum]|uniref:Protein kinase domain-containing protein n=1 Tax=Sphaerisporangium melleum TaxID=321316 RepID=A0A917VFK1_9ACTN|nr:serine/threonine-protein kinase [Sphaerisporangium melleum]GGK71087.1 hypothetical protein GCM10007964_12380 [Sphaerisporangium melleum]GII70220.1 hypothetical protein Sme01_26960 [Sphaerisporangium melleum]
MNQDDRLGPYRLLRRLGEGGMGVVHLALDAQGRQVAVKVLRAEVTGDDVARRRLAREVDTMRRVRSRHIAEVLDADVTGSRPYIVTRYVPGRPLDDAVKHDGPLQAGPLLRLAHGVAEALSTVHAAGVIHRDLKPGNVLMLDGEPVLIDFGIAQAVDATRLTQTGMFIGTPGYLAPEIIEGHEAGPEVDVHAWAGTMLYAATGAPPFGKGTLEMVFYNITAGRANIEAAPAVIRPLLRAAFNRDPARRPRAAELAAQLAVLVPPRSAPGRPRVPDEIRTVPDMPSLPATGTSLPLPDPRPPLPGRPDAGPVRPEAVPATDLPAAGLAASAEPRGLGAAAASTTAGASSQAGTGAAAGTSVGPSAGAFTGTGAPAGAATGTPAGEFVSLLGDAPQGPAPGDPWPTVRVTGDDLRKAGLGLDRAAGPGEGEVPTRYTPPSGPSRPWTGAPAAPLDQGEVPTRRVRPDELGEAKGDAYRTPGTTPPSGALPGLVRPGGPMGAPGPSGPGAGARGSTAPGTGRPPSPGVPGHGPATPSGPGRSGHTGQEAAPGGRPYPQALFEQAPDIFERTPHVRHPAQPQPAGSYVPTVHLPPEATPNFTGDISGSPVYTAAAVLALIIAIGAAVAIPVLAAVLVIPVAVLLRAADIAQPALASRRPAAAAAGDVLRVLGRPGALVKSIGVTLALVPYALILGVPVTLVLTFLVKSIPLGTALSWGVAVSLWIICAGPGVEGPGRQMGRALAAAFPSRGTAIALTSVLGVLAALAALYAVGTLVAPLGDAVWSPVDVGSLLGRLEELRKNTG